MLHRPLVDRGHRDGLRNPSAKALGKIAKGFGVSLSRCSTTWVAAIRSCRHPHARTRLGARFVISKSSPRTMFRWYPSVLFSSPCFSRTWLLRLDAIPRNRVYATNATEVGSADAADATQDSDVASALRGPSVINGNASRECLRRGTWTARDGVN